jgi:argininosuccinate synthase
MRIVLGYSGGLDTSVAIPWLKEQYGAEVVAVTVDLGQGRELATVRERALALGAVRAHVIDARDEFVRDYILRALQAGAVYEDRYLLATALGRPLIAKRLVDIARMEGASLIAHGCSGNANDQVRLDQSLRALDPSLQIVAPPGGSGLTREEMLDFAERRGIPAAKDDESPYSVDANLWGRSVAFGPLSDPWAEPPEEIYTLTRRVKDCPDDPAFIEIEFENGVPVRVNGVDMPLLEMIESLETIAGAHGVGRIDMIENRLAGSKSREIYEAPAAVVLHAAHKDLESLVVDRDLERLKHNLARSYADLVYNGQWFSAARESIDAFVAAVQKRVTGAARLKLFKGECRVTGRRSPNARMEAVQAPRPSSAQAYAEAGAVSGIIKLWEPAPAAPARDEASAPSTTGHR